MGPRCGTRVSCVSLRAMFAMSSAMTALYSWSFWMAQWICLFVIFWNLQTGWGYCVSSGMFEVSGGGGRNVRWSSSPFSSLLTASGESPAAAGLRLGMRHGSV
jgi:hypothetical protein